MAWYLYLIECVDGSLYTGITVDVQARYAAHAAGKGARYTRSHPPRRLLASIGYADRSAALKAEYAVKQLSAAGKREFAEQHAPPEAGAPGADSLLGISARVSIPLREIELNAVRAQGAGGQNVNKVSTAIHLRFDIAASSLPDDHKERLLALGDQRVSREGVVVIKAQRFRSQDKNRADALERLRELILGATAAVKPRKPTRPTRASRERRLEGKSRRAEIKAGRGKVGE